MRHASKLSDEKCESFPTKPGRANLICLTIGGLLLVVGGLGVGVNLIGFAIWATQPGTGLMADHIRSSNALSMGAATIACFVLLVLPGWYLRLRARTQIREWEKLSGTTATKAAAKTRLVITTAALIALSVLTLIWFFRDVGPREERIQGKMLSEWMVALRDPDAHVRNDVGNELVAAGEGSLPVLLAAMADTDAELRSYAVVLLKRLGSDAKSAIPQLCDASRDQEAGVRLEAVGALAELGATGERAVSSVVKALDDPDELVRQVAGDALRLLGENAVPATIQMLRDPDTRSLALQALSSIGPNGGGATSEVVELVRSATPLIRMQAIIVLGKIANDDDAPVPALTIALSDDGYEVRREAASYLVMNGSTTAVNTRPSIVPVLIEVLKDPQPEFRERAALDLGTIGPLAKEAVPALRNALTDAEPAVREASQLALELILRERGER